MTLKMRIKTWLRDKIPEIMDFKQILNMKTGLELNEENVEKCYREVVFMLEPQCADGLPLGFYRCTSVCSSRCCGSILAGVISNVRMRIWFTAGEVQPSCWFLAVASKLVHLLGFHYGWVSTVQGLMAILAIDSNGKLMHKVDTRLSAGSYGEDGLISLIQIYVCYAVSTTNSQQE